MELIDLILQHPDVTKQPRGNSEAVAYCPFHNDRLSQNPNLNINPKKSAFKCRSCGEGGYLKKLARAWGIDVPQVDRRLSKAPPPSITASAAIEQIQEAYGLRPDTIAHFGIEARPNMPSPNRATRGAWTYWTAAGRRYKSFDRKVKRYKYWWARGTDKEKRQATLYGMDDVPLGTSVVYLVNGEPSVWVCWQARVPAVAAFGEGNLPKEAVRHLADLDVKEVRIVLDLDQAGELNTQRDAEILREHNIRVSAGQLPADLGESADVADLYLYHHADDEAFRHAISNLPDMDLPDTGPLKGTRFFERDGRFYLKLQTRDGPVDVQLTNFTAVAEEEVMVDDGWTQTLHIVLSGRLDNGRPLEQVRIPASKVHNLEWITDRWGYSPTLTSGGSTKDQVREIMQRISLGRGLSRKTVFSHTGWRKIEGKWRYLMPGGTEQIDGVSVELPSPYSHYHFPDNQEDIALAARASLGFLDTVAHEVSIPLLAFTYLAPLQSILKPAFALWLRAHTGSFKSSLTALAVSHFGDFQDNTPPVTWEGTARGIERFLSDMKDCPAWVDDFNPRQSDRDMAIQMSKATAVISLYGNTAGRARMKADTTTQNMYLPQAALISTGEIYPTGQSVVARTLALEYSRSDVDVAALTRAQNQAHLYPHAMQAYVLWLGERYAELQKGLPAVYQELRTRVSSNDEQEHARTPGTLAALQIGIDLMAEFMCDIGAATTEEMNRLTDEAAAVFAELGRRQRSRLMEESTVDMYFNVIDSLLAQGRVTFHPKGIDKDTTFGVDLLGWYDDDYLYVDPGAAFNRVSKWFKDEGRTLGTTDLSLRRSLFEQAVLIKDPADIHLTKRIMVNGRNHRVMQLDMKRVPFRDLFKKGGMF